MGFSNSTEFQDNYVPVNRLYTTLTSDIDENATSIPVADTAGFPAMGWVSIDEEVIFYRSKSANSFDSIDRGADNTQTASHTNGSRVSQRINAAVFHEIMKSVKKRKTFILSAAETAAGTISEQNLSGFASRVRMSELKIVPTGGSQSFYIEFYRHNTFKGIDRLYKTVTLNTVESELSQAANAGDDFIFVNDVSGFSIDTVLVLGGYPGDTYEFCLIKEIDSTNNKITFFDNIEYSYDSGASVTQVYRDQSDFYYEDLDWTANLHLRVVNNDTISPVTVHCDIIAEVSDEA